MLLQRLDALGGIQTSEFTSEGSSANNTLWINFNKEEGIKFQFPLNTG